MTPGEITSIVIGGLAGTGTLCSGVWYLARMSGGVGQLKDDVTTIAEQTTKIGDSMTDFKIKIQDHDRRISVIENYEE
jgi:hypothetical protein